MRITYVVLGTRDEHARPAYRSTWNAATRVAVSRGQALLKVPTPSVFPIEWSTNPFGA